MNLNANPTVKELSEIISKCDDNLGHHILWVSKSGDVQIERLNGLSPIGFEQATPSMAVRYETFQQGNDYVGEQAAESVSYVSKLLNDLTTAWKNYSGQNVIYID